MRPAQVEAAAAEKKALLGQLNAQHATHAAQRGALAAQHEAGGRLGR